MDDTSNTMTKCEEYCTPLYIYIAISIFGMIINIYSTYNTVGFNGAGIGSLTSSTVCNVLCFFVIKSLCTSCNVTLGWVLVLCPLIGAIFQISSLLGYGASKLADKDADDKDK
jgi:hypothetical protein